MIINTFQEKSEIEKQKPIIKKAMLEQRKREKKGKFIKVLGAIGNLHKLIKIKTNLKKNGF
jgi:hypothetical protein